MMPPIPRMPMTTNQMTMTGPNTAPTCPVPQRCAANNPISVTIVSGMMKCSNAGVATLIPSIALNTEMAGVIMPSPYSKAAPKTPSPTSTARRRVVFSERSGKARAMSARIPPSPLLDARITAPRYFTETMRISEVKMSERIPSTLSRVGASGWVPAKHSLKAYRGLVPMSP